MIVLHQRFEIESYILNLQKSQKSIGFVPTMGALHAGHISLVDKSLQQNDCTIVSIFVNPTQFNNLDDLAKYPRTLDSDLAMLEKSKCDAVFVPEVHEMYPEGTEIQESYNFGSLETVMEGAFRPGHFKGVASIVRRLFDIVQPTRAYFGLKDYQQLAIITSLVSQYHLPVQIIPCDVVREPDGLAMSSRNVRLLPDERKQAALISQTLFAAKDQKVSKTVEEIKKNVIDTIKSVPLLSLEYFEIVDGTTLQSITNWSDSKKPVGCIAVHVGAVRLIDIIMFY